MQLVTAPIGDGPLAVALRKLAKFAPDERIKVASGTKSRGTPTCAYAMGNKGNQWSFAVAPGAATLNLTGALSVADGNDLAEGATTYAVVAAGAAGSLSAKLRRISADIGTLIAGTVHGISAAPFTSADQ